MSDSSDAPATRKLSTGPKRIDSVSDDFATLVSERPLSVGQTIGERYWLLEHLGDGGMGQVFVAENVAIRRRVAVKVLRPDLLADADFRKRFQVEAEAIAAIEHRNVARFYDLVVGDPTFMVMEYIPGQTLSSVLKAEGKLDIARAVRIACALAHGLNAAHSAGVIHRDIKPSNVILAADPELGEEPKLIDFGVAKVIGGRAEDQLTRAGVVVGTPHYMSPEQVDCAPIDARSDVYSLGCLLFHMLAGRPLFPASDDVKIMYHHVHTPPPSVVTLRPDCPPALDALLARALEKDRTKRFEGMKQLADALGEIARGSEASAVTGVTQLPRRRFSWAVPAAVLASALAGAGAGWRLRAPLAVVDEAPGFAVISSRPAGGKVELDGKPTSETTPAVLRRLTAGTHRVKVSLAGHSPVDQVFSLAAGERTVLDLPLPLASRQLEVVTVPAGALVYVDERLLLGRSPLTTMITEDDFHQVRVELEGYEVATQAVKPESREPTLTLPLTPDSESRGTLWVDANGAAAVIIDGVDTGFITPTLGIRTKPGDHIVELHDRLSAREARTKVHVVRSETVHLMMNLQAKGK